MNVEEATTTITAKKKKNLLRSSFFSKICYKQLVPYKFVNVVRITKPTNKQTVRIH